jgi:hypothetical protein
MSGRTGAGLVPRRAGGRLRGLLTLLRSVHRWPVLARQDCGLVCVCVPIRTGFDRHPNGTTYPAGLRNRMEPSQKEKENPTFGF